MSQKIGYFSVIRQDGSRSYLSYAEFYDKGPEFAQFLRGSGYRLCCACVDDYVELALNITKNGVIRVADNGRQDEHAEGCPKSVHYKKWLLEHANGVVTNDTNQLCFKISIPSGEKSESTSEGSSSSAKTAPENKRAGILDMIGRVNCLAWQKQTYSIKKQIAEANRAGEKPTWKYKSLEDFNRLFFGVSNEVNLIWRQETFTLYDIAYRRDAFYQADYQKKFFIYALLEKISPYKEDRKYQYLTVHMPSEKSANKAVVRVLTEDFGRLLKDYNDSFEAGTLDDHNLILTGYVRHDSFKTEDGIQNWITLIKGVFLEVSENGLYCAHPAEREIMDALCERRILFKKPVLPLPGYGGNIPTILIEQKGDKKDIIIDICKSSQEYAKKALLLDGSQYLVSLYRKDADPEDILIDLLSMIRK